MSLSLLYMTFQMDILSFCAYFILIFLTTLLSLSYPIAFYFGELFKHVIRAWGITLFYFGKLPFPHFAQFNDHLI